MYSIYKQYCALCLCALVAFVGNSQGGEPLHVDFGQLSHTHDINLPLWGPYSKRYAGISHIPDLKQGIRFDVTVLPGYYRSRALVPNVLFESGYYPWEITPAMDRITYRYELEWKDRVFVDVTYSVVKSNAVRVGMRCVNNSGLPQNLDLNLMGYVDFPESFPSVGAQCPPGTRWINAIDYQELKYARARSSDHLVSDGWLRAEARSSDYLDGSAIAKEFGKDRGDTATYEISIPTNLLQGTLSIRYRAKRGSLVVFQIKGLAEQKVAFAGSGEFELMQVPFSCPQGGIQKLVVASEGGNAIELNGFFVGSRQEAKEIAIMPAAKQFTPQISEGADKSIILKYKGLKNYYGMSWAFSSFVVREFLNDELDIFFRKTAQDHVSKKLVGNGQGHYANVFLRPLELAPDSEKTIYGLVCSGTLPEVKEQIALFSQSPETFSPIAAPPENVFEKLLSEGKQYQFSQERMRATLLANVVYPIYTQHGYIRHFTPGKWWNSLYTWDDGFIALGLGEIDQDLAVQCLNTYTTAVGSQSAFIHHGSPVPMQMYAFFELWNKTQSKELLAYFYPRLKQYYEFLAGKAGGSTTRALSSNLLKTWDYFYNSGGWDDYPAQGAVHGQKAEMTIAPVITTAHCIRAAKILRMAAEALSLGEDVRAYDQDIELFATALQTHSWDAQSGYFSYVIHDKNGTPVGPLREKQNGQNYNMGLDGAYPLFSGICTPEQQERLLEKIFSEKHMWTPSGICVVDQSAPYYRQDGYWNGAVWMPHQWLMWKTMLDLGRADLAWKIASKALDVWKKETDESYLTFEHFLATTGRGAGWHQFSALSAPVLNWFSAYYRLGSVSVGFEVRIEKQTFNPEHSLYQAELTFDTATAPHKRSLVLSLNPVHQYRALFNGEKLAITSPHKGLIQIELPATNNRGQLAVMPVELRD